MFGHLDVIKSTRLSDTEKNMNCVSSSKIIDFVQNFTNVNKPVFVAQKVCKLLDSTTFDQSILVCNTAQKAIVCTV